MPTPEEVTAVLSAKNTQSLAAADKDLYERFFALEKKLNASQQAVAALSARVTSLETTTNLMRAAAAGRGPSVG